MKNSSYLSVVFLLSCAVTGFAQVKDVKQLIDAIVKGKPGDTIEISAGIFELSGPLALKEKMQIRGAGIGKTIIKAADSWKPGLKDLPQKDNSNAYLFSFEKASGVKISHMTLTGPNLHGAIYCKGSTGVEFHHLRIESFRWSGIRTFSMKEFKIHDCEFHNAGGRIKWSGGAMYMHWTRNSEFWNNRITRSGKHPEFYGFKGRQAIDCRIHHNTIEVNFSIEYPFENDENVEIDHNVLHGTVSLPKHAGGKPIKENKHSFHFHHNWSRSSYALEWPRNGTEVDHNLFEFSTQDDVGNLISNFSKAPVPGPTRFHNNLVLNPGRGIIWSNSPHNHLYFYNNHIKANTLTRKDGLFGINAKSDFKTIEIRDNIIECTEKNPRPLLRNEASLKALIENNKLVNVSDTDTYKNAESGKPRGLLKPLKFKCGVNGEYLVDGWKVTPPAKGVQGNEK